MTKTSPVRSHTTMNQQTMEHFRYFCAIGNTSMSVPNKPGVFDFKLFLRVLDKGKVRDFERAIEYVRYDFDPSFSPPFSLIGKHPFLFEGRGWRGSGEFDVKVTIVWSSPRKDAAETTEAKKCDKRLTHATTEYTHRLCFDQRGKSSVIKACALDSEAIFMNILQAQHLRRHGEPLPIHSRPS